MRKYSICLEKLKFESQYKKMLILQFENKKFQDLIY